MSDQFLGEIRIVGFNFPPAHWAECDGAVMAISQNTALFSLLENRFGGNGQSTFALPNLQGMLPMGMGQGNGLTARADGETVGEESHTLSALEMPSHNHALNAAATIGNRTSPNANSIARTAGATPYIPSGTPVAMASQAITASGSGQPHNNLMPYLSINFVIALVGIFPPRS